MDAFLKKIASSGSGETLFAAAMGAAEWHESFEEPLAAGRSLGRRYEFEGCVSDMGAKTKHRGDP